MKHIPNHCILLEILQVEKITKNLNWMKCKSFVVSLNIVRYSLPSWCIIESVRTDFAFQIMNSKPFKLLGSCFNNAFLPSFFIVTKTHSIFIHKHHSNVLQRFTLVWNFQLFFLCLPYMNDYWWRKKPKWTIWMFNNIQWMESNLYSKSVFHTHTSHMRAQSE